MSSATLGGVVMGDGEVGMVKGRKAIIVVAS